MSCFNKKEKMEKLEEERKLGLLKVWFRMGEEFEYLGVTVRVAWVGMGFMNPRLDLTYVDKNGRFRNWSLSYKSAEAIHDAKRV